MEQIKNVAFGSDAEMFLKDITGRPFPICGLVGGTKEKPRKLKKPGYFIQEDNCALEFNIPICRTEKEWTTAFKTAINLVSKEVPMVFSLVAESSVEFDEGFLVIPQTMQFGCEPDFNAWEENINPRPRPLVPGLRTAAAHVHISWDDPEDNQRIELVKAADVFVSCPNIGNAPNPVRRTMYGRAGAFRRKDYGIEHRVLGNEWITDSRLVARIYNSYEMAIDFLNKGGIIDIKDKEGITDAINNCNLDSSMNYYYKYRKQYIDLGGY